MVTEVLYSGIKRPERDAVNYPSSSSKVKYNLSHASTLPRAFMTCTDTCLSACSVGPLNELNLQVQIGTEK